MKLNKEIYKCLEEMGWEESYCNNELLNYDYENCEKFWEKLVSHFDNNEDLIYTNDELENFKDSLGYILDVIQATSIYCFNYKNEV